MSGLLRDLLHAWRGLKQKPGFLIASLLTLAVGIGANVTIFSLVNGLSLRPMPFGDRTDRLVTIHPTHRFELSEPGWGDAEISYADFLDFRSASAVEGISGYLLRNFVLSGDSSSAERVLGGSITPDLFPMLGIEPFMGRQFRAEEAAAPGLESVVILTHGLWQRRYGSDPSIVGKTIMVNDRARTVVGVLPPGIKFPLTDQLYMPFRADEAPRASRNMNAVALLKPGKTLEQFQAELSSIAKRLEGQYPSSNKGFGVQVVPIRRSYVDSGVDRMGIILMTAVGFVLLIMCANLANLMLVRGASRQRELAVRSAMGAGRARLLWVALTESVLLAVPGTIIGLIGSQWAIDWMISSFPEELPYWFSFALDWRVAAFSIGISVFTTLAVGLLPALRAAKPDLANDLKEAGRGLSLGRGGHRLQATLAISQVALCFGLLVGANLMVRSFLAMQRADLGFDHRPILSARGYLAGDAYDDIRARTAFYQHVVRTLASLPGATNAVVTTSIPGDDGGSDRRLVIDGRTSEADEINVQSIGITPGLFDTIDLPLLSGRDFTGQETENPDANVALINQQLADRLWPGSSPLDRRIGFKFGDQIQWLRIVGVAPNVHYEEIGEDTDQSRLNVYVPYAMDGSRSMAMLVRAQGAPDALIVPARDALQRIGPTFPVFRLMPMRDLRRYTTWEQEFFGDIMAAFATAALLLACLGIYALISYSVGRRSREIGVRLALGARPSDVVGMLLRETVRVGGTGLLVGLALAMAIARALTGSLYGVDMNAWLFASMALPLAAALFLATWLPARRAAGIEPTVALRDE
ncbi:MAG TPA: ABC transporter permease [Vicinamibacterales bacterium]|jgi:predicted permease